MGYPLLPTSLPTVPRLIRRDWQPTPLLTEPTVLPHLPAGEFTSWLFVVQASQRPLPDTCAYLVLGKSSFQHWLRLGIRTQNVESFKFLIRILCCSWYVRKLTANGRCLALISFSKGFFKCFSLTPRFLPLKSAFSVS